MKKHPSVKGSAGVAPRRQVLVGVLLLLCLSMVVFWQVMAKRSRRPFDRFQLTASDFVGLDLSGSTWSFESVPVNSDPVEPNILAFLARPKRLGLQKEGGVDHVLLRLAHGYNMPECMRIKGYRVELLTDTKVSGGSTPGRRQTWRLENEVGDVSIWVSSIVGSHDFAGTDLDVRSLAFPRVGVPDEPGWELKGLSLSSLRHPVRNFRLLLRSRWNSSRCDLATFLRLKRPVWASESLLTLLATSHGAPVQPGTEAAVMEAVHAVHAEFHAALRAHRRSNDPGEGENAR